NLNCLFLIHFYVSLITYALVPVISVQLGEPVTFTCANMESRTWIYWYKQTSGDTLKMIVKHYVIYNFLMNLSIIFYISDILVLKYNLIVIISGNSKKTSSYTVVQQSTASESSGPEDSETLQCSVLSESENNSCSEDLSMFWFKAGSNRSYPNIIYTDGKRADNCKKSPNTGKKCIYNFPKNISSSDPGTYYCAVATCGEILLGNVIRKEGGNIPTLRNNHNNRLLFKFCAFWLFAIGKTLLGYSKTEYLQNSSK
uniref:Ig-like domain-containing protein n=1 Tax=Cyprinodon variegatus TaxID=28743 RepID=A0A3Q2C7Y0_CYPVA